ncbi:MAG: TonB-dependent receptor [Woeseiaceae bacterium]|jgi:iron complex outermembrane receptor protein
MNIKLSTSAVAIWMVLACVGLVPVVAISAELDEVVVTATKREESAQDIPISLEVVSGQQLADMSITDLGELSTTMPNFSIGDGVTNNLITIRGVGSGEDRSFEQSVSLFHDGIYMPRSRQTRTPFFDAERIEVLRGPQAVFFGLNSTAGAVAIHSAKNRPGDDLEVRLTGEYEMEYSGYSATAIVGGSPTDTIGLRLAVQTNDTGDGYIENATSGDVGNSESTLVRLTGVFEPSDKVTITAKYDYADYEVVGLTGEVLNRFAGLVEPGDGVLDWRNSGIGERLDQIFEIAPNNQSGPGALQEVNNFMVNADFAMGEHTLTALVGLTDYTYELGTDLDSVAAAGLGLPGLALDATSYEEYEQTSAELRLTSPDDRTIEYVAGIYYQTSDLKSDQSNIIFFPPDVIVPGAPFSERGTNLLLQDQTLLSLYASATFNLSDSARIIAGVRYSDDEKDWSRESICENSFNDGTSWNPGNLGGGACALASDQSGTVSDDEVMPEIAFQLDFGDNSMAYAKYGESAKSGGAATGTSIPDGNIVYGPESAKGFEIGLKSLLADGALQLNIAYFDNEFDDLQVKSSIVEGTTVITRIGNAGKASSKGFEIDMRWAASDYLSLGATVASLDAKYDEFNGISCNTSGSLPPYLENGIQSGCDAAGENLPFAADLTGSAFIDFDVPVGSRLAIFGRLMASLTDDHFTDGTLEPTLVQESYTRVDARLGIGANDRKWSIAVIGKNLSDEKINMSSQPLGAYDLAYLMMPRTITVQGTYNFAN